MTGMLSARERSKNGLWWCAQGASLRQPSKLRNFKRKRSGSQGGPHHRRKRPEAPKGSDGERLLEIGLDVV